MVKTDFLNPPAKSKDGVSIASSRSRYRFSSIQARQLTFYRTTTIERFLLFLTIMLIPLQDSIPPVKGLSIVWFVFAALGLYVFLHRLAVLERVWLHPIFSAGYVLLAIGILIESIHPERDFFEILRIGQMVVGAVLVASLCRDRKALQIALLGLVVAGIYISASSFTAYGTLSQDQVSSFDEASRAAMAASGEKLLELNSNAAAATAARGAIVAIVFALFVIPRFRRYLFWAAAGICLLGVFLTASRSGIVTLVLSTAAVLFASGFKNKKAILAVAFFVAIAILVVPGVIWYRMSFSTDASGGHMEARARVYTTAIELLPEYLWIGVGVGNFYGPWGRQTEFFFRHGVIGSHNGLFQVTIYWGLPGLFAVFWVIWRAYQSLPKHDGNDPLALCLIGVSLSLLLTFMAQHSLYAKEYAVALGLLAGSHRWIWPGKHFLIRRL